MFFCFYRVHYCLALKALYSKKPRKALSKISLQCLFCLSTVFFWNIGFFGMKIVLVDVEISNVVNWGFRFSRFCTRLLFKYLWSFVIRVQFLWVRFRYLTDALQFLNSFYTKFYMFYIVYIRFPSDFKIIKVL